MNNQYIKIVSCILLLFLFSSCSFLEYDSVAESPIPTSSLILTPSAIYSPPEVRSTQTPVGKSDTSVFGTTDQVTDGKLQLTISESVHACHKPGSIVPLIITYDNLTTSTLRVVDFNAVSTVFLRGGKGQLFPIFTTQVGEKIFTPQDFYSVQVFNDDSPVYNEIPPKGKFDLSVENYYLPSEVVVFDEQGKKQVETLAPGQYLLQFVYNANADDDNIWNGEISSNKLDICVNQ